MSLQNLYSRAPITTLLLVSFVALFTLQMATGVDVDHPSSNDLRRWGANALTLTMSNQPWRLVSSAFLHIGLMHLLFNAYAMYYLGQVAERMIGSANFLLLFLLSAIGGNLLNCYDSVFWQVFNQGSGLSAGASGGIMGIGAALLVLALFKVQVVGIGLNLRNLVLIMGFNLVYGFVVTGIDNAGHIGGAVTGAILTIGIVYSERLLGKQPAPVLQPKIPTAAAVTGKKTPLAARLSSFLLFFAITLLFCGLWLYLHRLLMPYLMISPSL